MTEEATGALRLDEAVALAHALLTQVAETVDVRILFIKGPTAVQMGARPPRPSSDVDAICEPGGLDRLGVALEQCGWRRRVPKSSEPQFVYSTQYLFEHSFHYVHDEWPCDLDLHFNFPGFLAPDDVVFEALWQQRVTAQVAHWPVPCADFVGQAAIVGLHALRDPGVERNTLDLIHVAERLRRRGSANDLFALAQTTGASETLKPLLDQVLRSIPSASLSEPERLRQWLVRTSSDATDPTHGATTWLLELQEAPWQKKASVVRRACFPPPRLLLGPDVAPRVTTLRVAHLYVRRWWRVARRTPRGLRSVLAARRRSE